MGHFIDKHFILQAYVRIPVVPHFSTFDLVNPFSFGHFNRCIEVLHYDFYLHSDNDHDIKYILGFVSIACILGEVSI